MGKRKKGGATYVHRLNFKLREKFFLILRRRREGPALQAK